MVKIKSITKILAVLLITGQNYALVQQRETLYSGEIKNSGVELSLNNSLLKNSQNNSMPEDSSLSLFKRIFQRDKLTGDWWGLREDLVKKGIEIEMIYKGELFSNLYGGVEKASKTLDNFDLIITNDLQKSIGIPNSNLLIQFLGNSGGAPSELAGVSQGITNIEAIPTWKLYQFLIESKFFNEQLSLMFGLYDLNSEFDSRQTSAIFINPSHGIGPDFSSSGVNGPSIFPTTSLTLRLKYQNESGFYIQTAFLDGVPGDPDNPLGTKILLNKADGLLISTELGLVTKENEIFESKIAFGSWMYSADFERIEIINKTATNTSLTKNYGFYFSAEKNLYTDKNDQNKNLYGFLRLGIANARINPVDYYLGGGLTFYSLFGDSDQIGVALAYAHNSEYFRNLSNLADDLAIRNYEINLELTYSFGLTPWLNIQPDIQYIISPSYSFDNYAYAAGIRIILNL